MNLAVIEKLRKIEFTHTNGINHKGYFDPANKQIHFIGKKQGEPSKWQAIASKDVKITKIEKPSPKNRPVQTIVETPHTRISTDNSIKWDDSFKQLDSIKFVYKNTEYQGRYDATNKRVIYPVISSNKLSSTWLIADTTEITITKFIKVAAEKVPSTVVYPSNIEILEASQNDFRKHTPVVFAIKSNPTEKLEGWLHNTFIYFKNPQNLWLKVYQHDVYRQPKI